MRRKKKITGPLFSIVAPTQHTERQTYRRTKPLQVSSVHQYGRLKIGKERKGNREECNNCRGISLLSVPLKIYERILSERMMKITGIGGFRKGRGCIDQIFAIKILVEKYLVKDRKLFAAFMDLENTYDRVDRKGLWDTLRVYGVGS